MILIFASLLLASCYGLSKLITGALGFLVFSVVTCAFFTWRYVVKESVPDTLEAGSLNIFEAASNSLSTLDLPAAIFTFVMSISSAGYLILKIKLKD